MKSLLYLIEKKLTKVREAPAEYLFGTDATVTVHVNSEAKPERRVSIHFLGKTYFNTHRGYYQREARLVPVSCDADGPDVDAAAPKILTALGVFDAG